MKKTLKAICGMSLVLTLGLLSFVVVDDNKKVEAAEAKITINTWAATTKDCTWEQWLNFGTLTWSADLQTWHAQWTISHNYISSIQQNCSLWLDNDLTNWNQTISKWNLYISWASLTVSIWNLNTNSAITNATGQSLSTDKTIYQKTVWKVWKWSQTVTADLWVPGYLAAWTYKATLKATSTDR